MDAANSPPLSALLANGALCSEAIGWGRWRPLSAFIGGERVGKWPPACCSHAAKCSRKTGGTVLCVRLCVHTRDLRFLEAPLYSGCCWPDRWSSELLPPICQITSFYLILTLSTASYKSKRKEGEKKKLHRGTLLHRGTFSRSLFKRRCYSLATGGTLQQLLAFSPGKTQA